MRRPSLSTKLLAAALPLVLTVAALLALTVRSDLADARDAENGAELGAVWQPLITALGALDAETDEISNGAAPAPATRQVTDQAINALRDQIESLGAFDAASRHITAGRSALSAARRNLDMAVLAPDLPLEVEPFEAYSLTSRELVAVGQLLPSEAGDPSLGRELLAVVKLAEAKLSAHAVIIGTTQWQTNPTDVTPLATARNAYAEMEATLGEFEAIAPEEWATQYRQSGFPTELAKFRGELDRAMRSTAIGETASFDTESFAGLVSNGVQFQSAISQSIVENASVDASSARRTTLIRIAISLGAVLLAAIIALLIIRSITRRVAAVSASAKQVAAEQLPALVEALRDPRGKATVPKVQRVDAKGNDELAELASAFNSMQDTLVDVAQEQVEVLRRGVSDIFVTMARRNRSLIDRQLALLDEFEAEVDDPTVLGNYYQLDHLATRMRRNSESLLVLANAEPKRRRVKATEIDDVVRASIGEVEDYRRVDVEHLESLQVRGTVVADVAHLIAELLDNATSFSPPESKVRLGGRRAENSYLLRIVDSGIGIPTERLNYLNDLLRDPPVAGLSVESTLGISVVSMLANKHGISVTLAPGNPGLSVDISLPSTLFGPIEQPATKPDSEPIDTAITWNDDDSQFLAESQIDGTFDALSEADDAAPTLTPILEAAPEPWPDQFEPADTVEPSDEQPATESDWTRMSLDLSAFQSGQRSAQDDAEPEFVPDQAVDVPTPTPEPTPDPWLDQTEPVSTMESSDEQPVAASDWTRMSLDLSAFESDQRSAQNDDLSESVPEQATEQAADLASEPTLESEPSDDLLADQAIELALAAFDEPVQPEPTALNPAEFPPPPSAARMHGEFDSPLAPPVTAAGPSRGPVAPTSARSAPARLPETPPTQPALPVRSPGATPDSLDPLGDVDVDFGHPPANDSREEAPAALASAFAMSQSDPHPPGGLLPTRTRFDDANRHEELPIATTQSRLDPEALRERLRAFQAEFTNGVTTPEASNDHSAFEGDPR